MQGGEKEGSGGLKGIGGKGGYGRGRREGVEGERRSPYTSKYWLRHSLNSTWIQHIDVCITDHCGMQSLVETTLQAYTSQSRRMNNERVSDFETNFDHYPR